jgi:hypothetical protein
VSLHINTYSFYANKEQRINLGMSRRYSENILEEKKRGGVVSLCMPPQQEKRKEGVLHKMKIECKL